MTGTGGGIRRLAVDGSADAGGWMVASLAALVLLADAITLVRLHAFEAHPPTVLSVEAPIELFALHKRGTILQVDTPTGWIALTTGPANVLGTARSGIDLQAVTQGAVASVSWIDAPANLSHGTVHYPVHVAQAGRVLLHRDGAAAVAAAEREDLLPEMECAGAVCVIGVAWALLAQARERRARRPA